MSVVNSAALQLALDWQAQFQLPPLHLNVAQTTPGTVTCIGFIWPKGAGEENLARLLNLFSYASKIQYQSKIWTCLAFFCFYIFIFVIKQYICGQSADSELLLKGICIHIGFTL